MRRITQALFSLPCVLFINCCDQSSEFITNTSPFYSERVVTPSGGQEIIAGNSKKFAETHEMGLHYVPGHFTSDEFTISVTKPEVNIVASNVKAGKFTIVTAYARNAPSEESHALVKTYMCEVMQDGC